ncbi:prepilin-type N-terminal cleavage/methylation domain-containing protein [Candidatus Uhrbacteria bacterium]|nr:prepilin-type N-terminal cleavage/methylation domain-containing protein [Candidatus Uhrbacteria bacterium]
MGYRGAFNFQLSTFPLQKNQQRGFTLVEILVSMGILLSLMTISIIGFSKATRSEYLRYGARRLADALQSTISFAQSGTHAQYTTAQSYGVHTDIVSQQIVLFADQNISTGVGRWDGATADASLKKDEPMQEVLTYDVGKRGDVKLERIVVMYHIDGGAQQSKDVTMIDIASVPPSANMVFSGGSDFPAGSAGQMLSVERVELIIKEISTGKTSKVVIHALSGRIDVDY